MDKFYHRSQRSDNYILYSLQVVVGSKQDVDRVDLPFEEIEATVRFFLGSILWTRCDVNILLDVG